MPFLWARPVWGLVLTSAVKPVPELSHTHSQPETSCSWTKITARLLCCPHLSLSSTTNSLPLTKDRPDIPFTLTTVLNKEEPFHSFACLLLPAWKHFLSRDSGKCESKSRGLRAAQILDFKGVTAAEQNCDHNFTVREWTKGRTSPFYKVVKRGSFSLYRWDECFQCFSILTAIFG